MEFSVSQTTARTSAGPLTYRHGLPGVETAGPRAYPTGTLDRPLIRRRPVSRGPVAFQRGSSLAIEIETLKAMVRDYGGFKFSDEELERMAPALEQYLEEMDKLRELDLSDVMSVRLLKAREQVEQ